MHPMAVSAFGGVLAALHLATSGGEVVYQITVVHCLQESRLVSLSGHP